MDNRRFDAVVNNRMDRVASTLYYKNDAYNNQEMSSDRLRSFKTAAHLQGISPREALAGMMAKHTASIYDMCRDGHPHSLELWDEKITDHINYLILLDAVVQDEMDNNVNSELVSDGSDKLLNAPEFIYTTRKATM